MQLGLAFVPDVMPRSAPRPDVTRWLRTLSAPWFIRLEYERGEWQFNRPRDGQ